MLDYRQKKRLYLAKKCVTYGKYKYADMLINFLVKSDTKNPELLKEIALLYTLMNNKDKAIDFITLSFKIEPGIDILETMANINAYFQKHEDAAIQYEELIKYKPEEKIYTNCISAYKKLDLLNESIRIGLEGYEKLKSPIILTQVILSYIICGMEEEAIKYTDIMKKEFPNNALTSSSLGFLYEAIHNDYETAKKHFLTAAKKGFLDAYYNLAVCCKQHEDFEEAEKYLKRLISLNANSQMDYFYTLGSVYFAQRKLKHGHKYYKNRSNVRNTNYKQQNNLWDGKDYPEKTLLVSSEQGLGDNIQFIRYIPMAARKFKHVIYITDNSLIKLFKDSFPKNKFPNFEIRNMGEHVPYDKFVYIMDLPCILNTNFHNVPAAKSYLTADEDLVQKYKEQYFQTDRCKIGLCWRAKGMGLRDATYRTIDAPHYFKPLFDLENAQYYSFQKDDLFNMTSKYPQIIDISNTFDSFADTAAAMKNLDIFITVDTSVAHLAGALGIKTYLLLCHAPDWRWFDNKEKTEWYPSVTIIKQQDRRTWEDVSQKLTEYIKKDLKNYKS